MAAYVLRRVMVLLPTAFLITLLGFIALELAPGDPLMRQMSDEMLQQLSPEQLGQRRADLGLEGSVVERYAAWTSGILQGEWGFSVVSGRPVLAEIRARLFPTAVLMGTALAIAVTVGLTLGVVAAIRRNTLIDHSLTTMGLAMISVPSFVIGLVFIFVFAVQLRWLPPGGMYTAGNVRTVGELVRHLIMPAMVLGLVFSAQLLRYMRASVIDVMSRDFIHAAKVKGISKRRVLFRHVLKNAMLPIITILGLLVPFMIVGAVITEEVFGWPGMGRLVVRAALSQDPALLMGVMMVMAIAVMIGNLLADIAYAWVDPRVRYRAN